MPSPIFNVGTAPNDGTGDPLRTAFQKINRLPLWDAVINAGSGDYLGTTEAKLTLAVADAKANGKPVVWIPKSMQPFNGSLVTFDASVLMMREGGPMDGSMELDAYGVTGDGVTDCTAALQVVENLRPSGRTLRGVSGKIYALNANTGATLLKIKNSGLIDFSGATLLYTNAGNLTTGSDGRGLGVINFLADDISFAGTIDCNTKARYGIVYQDTKSRFYLNCTIQNTLETNGVWSGMFYSASIDVTGVTAGTAAKNIHGFLRRPNCPLIDASSAIIAHSNSTAVLIGDDTPVGAATGLALVSNNQIAPAICFQRMDTRGVDSFGFAGTGNSFLGDIFCHDVGLNTCEFYGTNQTNSDNIKTPQGKKVGPIVKGLPSGGVIVGSGWWWNDSSDGTNGPNIWVDGGSAQLGGVVDLNPVPNAGGVSATQGGRIIELISAPSEATLVAGVDASLSGNVIQVTLTAARLVGAPTNSRKGQKLEFSFIQGGAGGFAVTWNAVFKVSWSDTGNTTGKRSCIAFRYDGTNWNQIGGQAPYV